MNCNGWRGMVESEEKCERSNGCSRDWQQGNTHMATRQSNWREYVIMACVDNFRNTRLSCVYKNVYVVRLCKCSCWSLYAAP
jgi:hypothetical protein